MHYANRISLCFTQVLILLWLTASVFGQAIPPKQQSDTEFAAMLSARMKQVDEVTDLDETAKNKIKDLYKQALAEIDTANKWAAENAKNEKIAKSAPNDLKDTKAALAQPLKKFVLSELPDSLPKIEQDISASEAELVKLRKALAEDEAALKNGADRRAKISMQINKAKDTLTSLNEQLNLPTPANESPMMISALRVQLESRRRAIDQEIACCEQEMKAYEACIELLPLRRDLDARKVAQAEQEIKQWQAFVNQRRKNEAEEQAKRAATEFHQADQAPQVVKDLFKANTGLASERKELVDGIVEITQQRDRINQQHLLVANESKRIKDKVAVAEKSKSTGLLGLDLRKQRESLPNVRAYNESIEALRQMIGNRQIRWLELQEERGALWDINLQTQVVLQNLAATDGNSPELAATVREALKNKQDYLDALISDYNAYFDKVLDLIATEQQLITETEDCARFIDERVFWVASSKPLSVTDLRNAVEAFCWLVGPKAWADVGGTLFSDVRRNSGVWSLAFGLFVGLIYCRMRMRERIQEIGEKAGRGNCYRFLPTLEVTLLTSLVAIGWPGLMWYFGWRLNTANASTLCKSLGEGLLETAQVYLALEMLRYTCCRCGLGESHFGWPAPALKLLRQCIRWFSMPALALMCVAVTMAWQEKKDCWDSSLGRISFIAAILCFSYALHRVLRPTSDVFRAMIAERRGKLTERFRYVWYSLIVLTPMALAILAVAGYHYTARQLVIRAILSIYVLVGGIVCRALLLRWTLVNQRKLAMEQARKRRAASQENVANSESQELLVAAAPERDLATINTQSRRFIEYSLGVACLLVVFSAWVDVLPALGSINYAVGTAPVTEIKYDQVAGKFISSEELRAVKLSDLLLAIIILATTITAARNIPGLLEMAVLQHLPFDAGARYAVATVCRYMLIVVGVSWCCGSIGVGWSKIQWLAAAMSLGLGFGLQEIFANFVSGLIILFERPVRVGDVVTIDTITGVVSRIRMRATTVTDADRKELIIPNKEFITGRVLNWTLSDEVNRVVVKVGVAYGSDTESAAKLLERIALDHPMVLKDPAPQVTLEAFGDSSLSFVLRCFLPNMDNRNTVIHELHIAIERQFREAGIEIPFPTRDIRIHATDFSTAVMAANSTNAASWPSTNRAA